MNCAFCQRNEDELKEIISPIIDQLKEEISKLEQKKSSIKEIYAKENGFIEENFSKVKKIDDFILSLSFREFMVNKEIFIKKDTNLNILYNYYKKYQPKITDDKPIRDLLKMYVNEPTIEKLENAESKIKNGINLLSRNIEIIELKNKLYKFYGNNIFPIKKIFEIKDNITINNELKIHKEKYYNEIYLCRYCFYFLNIPIERLNITLEEEQKEKIEEELYKQRKEKIEKDKNSSMPEWDLIH